MRAIDADRLQKQFDEKSTNPNYRVNIHNIKSIICNAPTIEAIPKADYENRLKADIKAILVELQLEIEEKFNDRPFSYNHHQRTEFYHADAHEKAIEAWNTRKEADNGNDD